MNTSRRKFLKKTTATSLAALATITGISKLFATTPFFESKIKATTDSPLFTLLPLPYKYDALEPHIDKMTMEIHHSKHHQAYVNNLNKALETIKENILGNPPLMENIFNNVEHLPIAIRNNAGGHYNHSLFWETMVAPVAGVVSKPKGKLEEAIKSNFGSFDALKKQFTDIGVKHFGSGWVWLVKTKENKLVLTSTANQDNPLMNLPEIKIKGEPILGLDVWEHAYYLKNENRRVDYINSWWNVVNWKAVENLYNGK